MWESPGCAACAGGLLLKGTAALRNRWEVMGPGTIDLGYCSERFDGEGRKNGPLPEGEVSVCLFASGFEHICGLRGKIQ